MPVPTQGTETSHYLVEKKAKATPSVAASERGIAQTQGACPLGVVGPVICILDPSRTVLESSAIAGDSPVGDRRRELTGT